MPDSRETAGPRLTATQLSDPGTPANPKPLLLLGASLGTDALVLWERVVPLLGDRVHLVAWDLPGHGRSPAATEAFGVADLADAVARLAHGIGAPADRYYAGVSLGGAVGLELGLRHPGLFAGIAVICSGPALGTPDGWRERAAAVRAQGTASLVTASAGRWFAPGWLDREATLGGRLLTSLTHADDESYALCCEALAGHDVTARLPGITDPLLAIAGELDAVAPPALAAQVAGAVRDGRRLTANGVAHLAPAEDPQVTAVALAELLGLGAGPDPADEGAVADRSPHDTASDAAMAASGALGVSRCGAAVPTATLAQLYDGGMAVRREVLGDEHVDRANASIDDITRDFQEFITRYAWGSIWTRPGLDRVTRSAITITAMIAGGHREELAMHLRSALRNGMTREQIVEVLLQSAIYCSVPSANTAFAVAREVLADDARTSTPEQN
ncbi:3-oxoadipate enol-lactonase/4-carboxymuconolactone decarboxylase [Kineosphaera limosa]|uniref:3-oxoadipate enol-lactone hydrolase/4-carboxymuconolactone decarboxylase n=1 Tax=Kineosphaera limosa NBRC 100340 TaxID=1184609 RepID=K6WN73_9MICO|nr:4-carboxymuconolactone decarboxylase [Kineosphaera limosa]NYE02138.1 3-oxoadipate enol-lactonase/4-carboxymuconolactone decarboxylase [Kineosphaera limosa]GAB95261.1 3-oxoadipate enol-lactone hydrolase/4-carboxymuconolactone decarboxylase [Kineosphaera limosa NBRC 100340]